jgi:hypothetical protein
VRDFVVAVALAVAAINGAVGLYGAWLWYRAAPSRIFWPLLRLAQGAAVGFAALVAILALTGHHPRADLFYLYALLPLAIGLVAEQLRIAAADAVLAARDLADAQAVGALPEEEQRSIVVAILRRELGVMAAAALVVCFLALRAAGTAGGFS